MGDHRYPRTRLGDALVVLGITAIGIALQAAIADGTITWQWTLAGGVVAVLGVLARDRFRPSIWTPWGRFWLRVEALGVHPLDAEKRAEYEFERGFNDPEFEDETKVE